MVDGDFLVVWTGKTAVGVDLRNRTVLWRAPATGPPALTGEHQVLLAGPDGFTIRPPATGRPVTTVTAGTAVPDRAGLSRIGAPHRRRRRRPPHRLRLTRPPSRVAARRGLMQDGGVTRTLATPDGPVAVLDAGDGPAVLFVPGYTGTKEDFAPLLPLLADAGLRAVAMDLPGQYETPGPDDPAAYTPEALSRSVLAVAAQLDRPHLVGHSFGGLVSRAAVIADPGAVRSLVLMGSGPSAIGGDRRERMAALEPVLRAGGLPAVYEALETIAAGDPDWASMPAEQRDFLRTRFLAGSPAGLQGMGDALRAEPDRTGELAAAGRPAAGAVRRARRRLVARRCRRRWPTGSARRPR